MGPIEQASADFDTYDAKGIVNRQLHSRVSPPTCFGTIPFPLERHAHEVREPLLHLVENFPSSFFLEALPLDTYFGDRSIPQLLTPLLQISLGFRGKLTILINRR